MWMLVKLWSQIFGCCVGRKKLTFWILTFVEWCRMLPSLSELLGCRCPQSMFLCLAVLSPCLDIDRILTPILKSDQFWCFFIFYPEGHRLVEKLLLTLFFMINAIDISSCAEPMRRDAFSFLILKNISAPATSDEWSSILFIEIAIILFVR